MLSQYNGMSSDLNIDRTVKQNYAGENLVGIPQNSQPIYLSLETSFRLEANIAVITYIFSHVYFCSIAYLRKLFSFTFQFQFSMFARAIHNNVVLHVL